MSAVEPLEALSITRVFQAPIERVYSAWTKPEFLSQWFAPPGFKVVQAQAQVLEGGQYAVVIQGNDGTEVKHYGQYVQVTPPKRLVFTWELNNKACGGGSGHCETTLVTLDFSDFEGGTQLVLTHERLPTQETLEGHKMGWEACLGELTEFLVGRS